MIRIVQADPLRCYAGVIICPCVAYFAPCMLIFINRNRLGKCLRRKRFVIEFIRNPGLRSGC